MAYQIIFEPGIGQFREFESPRVHSRINAWGLVLVQKFSCGKREGVSCQHSMTDRREMGLSRPYVRYNLKARTGGKKGRRCDHGFCPEAGK